MTGRTCETCRHWTPLDPRGDIEGRCRATPGREVHDPRDGRRRTVFPVTLVWETCPDWQPKPEPPGETK